MSTTVCLPVLQFNAALKLLAADRKVSLLDGDTDDWQHPCVQAMFAIILNLLTACARL